MTEETPGAAGPFDSMLCFAVYAAGHAFNRVYKPLLDRLGLTYPQFLVVLALRHGDGQTVGMLGDRLFLESNTLTPLIKRLEAAGFVRRERDRADERVVRVFLTEQGRTAGEEAACLRPEVGAATGLDAEQAAALQTELVVLGDSLRGAVAS